MNGLKLDAVKEASDKQKSVPAIMVNSRAALLEINEG
jgi:hypothetical protein